MSCTSCRKKMKQEQQLHRLALLQLLLMLLKLLLMLLKLLLMLLKLLLEML